MFVPEAEGEWDDFVYRQSIDVLARYRLIQLVQCQWPGATIYSLVQGSATREQDQQWQWRYIKFVLAAHSQTMEEDNGPKFCRHLVMYLPDVRNLELDSISTMETGGVSLWENWQGYTMMKTAGKGPSSLHASNEGQQDQAR